MSDHLRDAAMKTCDRHALARSYHVPPALTAIDVVGVLLKPSTLISLTVLGVCVWALCGFPGLV
jgi:hypothetical protein